MAGSMSFYLLIYILAALFHFSAAQEFIHPPASGSINTDPQTYQLGKEIKLEWNCDYDHVNVYLWKDHGDSSDPHSKIQLLDKEQNPGKITYTPDKIVPLDHDTQFHFQVEEVDPDSGDATGNAFDSASFDIQSDNAPTTLTKTITSTDAHHHKHTSTMTTVVSGAAMTTTAAASSTAAPGPTDTATPDNGIFPANMSTGATIGIGVAFASTVLIVAAAVTLWIRHRNKREYQKYDEEEKRISSWPSDIQQPFPQDPRAFRHTLWAPEHRGQTPWSPMPSPLPKHYRRSAPEPRRLNGLSQKSLPPLPRE